jgi:adenylate kinase
VKLILLGPPGAGKGTLAKTLADAYKVPHISTGDIFRAAIKEGTPLGKKAKSFLDSGGLVPDEVTIGIVTERLQAPDCAAGFLLDGFPRTVAQADALSQFLAGRQLSLDAVVNLEVPDEAILRRLTGRRVCKNCGAPYHTESMPPKTAGVCDRCGGEVYQRADDAPETVAQRLKVYAQQTAPLIQYYQQRGLLLSLDGTGTIPEVAAAATAALAGWTKR